MDLTHFENFKTFLNIRGMSDVYALVLYSQAQHETGKFTSELYENAHNMFGMKVARVRPQNRNGSYGDYAMYQDDAQSLLDRIAWDAYVGIDEVKDLNLVQDYLRVVSPRYSEDPEYFEKWFNVIRINQERYRPLIVSQDDGELDYLLATGDDQVNFGFGKWLKFLLPVLILVGGYFGYKKYLKK